MARTRDYEGAYEEVGAEAAPAPQGRAGIQSPKAPVHFAGVQPQDIEAGATVTFALSLNMDMNPRQIVIPDDLASKVALIDATIGPINLNAGDGPFPGDAFRHDGTLRFSPAVPATTNQPLKIRVKNTTATKITGFYLGVVGEVKRAS